MASDANSSHSVKVLVNKSETWGFHINFSRRFSPGHSGGLNVMCLYEKHMQHVFLGVFGIVYGFAAMAGVASDG